MPRRRTRRNLPRVIAFVNRQTGMRISIPRDRMRKALGMGKRLSKSGRTYWETRKNRSDKRRSRL